MFEIRKHTVPTPYLVGDIHYYSTEIDGEVILFDTGPPTEYAIEALERNVDLKKLKYVFFTHTHVDHFGLAYYLAEKTDAEILISRRDALKLRRHHDRIFYMKRLLTGDAGFDDDFINELENIFLKGRVFPDVPKRYRVVEETDIAERLGIYWLSCSGHSQSDLVYIIGDNAITGDALLRNIFQVPLLDADMESMYERFRNYDAYCDTLIKFKKLKGLTILPAHNEYVDSLEETVIFYVTKIFERSRPLREIPTELSVKEVVDILFGKSNLDAFIKYLKASEIVFFRDFLSQPEKLKNSLEQLGIFDKVKDEYYEVIGKRR